MTRGAADRVTAMTKLLGFVGGMAGSYLGWAVGEPFGLLSAYVVSTAAFGVGVYLGRLAGDRLGD